jgi:hypothetical protein
MNDHLAGSAAAVELVERIRDNNEGTDLARAMETLLGDIEADQATLAAIMERLGVEPSSPKQAAGKVLETLSRFRLNERVTGSAEVSLLMELETLSLGIEGKLSLWRSLGEVTGSLAALAEFDLPTLASRAVSQRAVVEPFRLQAAGAALA